MRKISATVNSQGCAVGGKVDREKETPRGWRVEIILQGRHEMGWETGMRTSLRGLQERVRGRGFVVVVAHSRHSNVPENFHDTVLY